VWSRSQPEVENLSLSGDSYTISNTWWPFYGVFLDETDSERCTWRKCFYGESSS
jgi:hypothetical protein